MPRRRHEEERSSSSSRSSSPRTERRSSSSPRPAAARSPSRETSGRSSSRSSTPRSSPQPRASPAATYVSSSPAPSPPPTRSSSPRTERSTPPTYRTRSDDDYNLFGGIFRGMRSDDQDSSDDGDGGTSHGETLFGDTVRTLLCPPPPVVSEPVAGLVSPCDTQSKALQDCLNDFDTDIKKCQLYMNTLSRCKKNSDTKLYPVVRGSSDARASSDSESRFLTFVRAMLCPRTVVGSEVSSIASVAAPVSICATQDKIFQDCLNDYETYISKCQLYMNMLSGCKKSSKLDA